MMVAHLSICYWWLSVRGQCIKVLPAIKELHCYGNDSRGIGTSLAGLEQCSHMVTWTTWVCKCACMLRWITQLAFLPFMTSSSTNFHKNKKCSEQSGAEILTGSIMTLVQMLAFWHVCMGNEFDKFLASTRDFSFAAHFCLLPRSGILEFYVWGGMVFTSEHGSFWVEHVASWCHESVLHSTNGSSSRVYITMSVHVIKEVKHSFTTFSSSCTLATTHRINTEAFL